MQVVQLQRFTRTACSPLAARSFCKLLTYRCLHFTLLGGLFADEAPGGGEVGQDEGGVDAELGGEQPRR